VSPEIVTRGGTLGEAFAAAALRVLGLAVDPARVEPREVREVRAHGASPEELLARWIGECVYLHEIEAFACHAIDLAVFDVEARAGGEPLRLHAFLRGEELAASHGPAHAIGTGTPTDVSIRSTAGGYEVRFQLGVP